MDTNSHLAAHLRPTTTRPLLGLTVLVVEDSRYACDAMRLLCLRSGARIRRADCLKSARRHLQVYRPSVVIVDLGLPDGSGAELISELTVACPRVDVVIGTSGDSFSEEVALAAGADGFLAKPVSSVSHFQNTILAGLPPERRPTGPRLVTDEPILPDPMAYRDDMAHAAEVLVDQENERSLRYVTQFLAGVARSAGDGALQKAAEDLASARRTGKPTQPTIARVASLVQDRLADRVAI
ncbi:response regulator [Sagittula sp. NFXS13]|uniref:Response regulator RpfG family c-di-GMP phosphodiesterase n=1 Tax=Sagittula marina TaxID=943940 RepID=A0A7W6DNK7_9RHOB|nr:response regulator [Sagittula marina]MBB3984027.1 response regulator RpfG family c-di-GMP phosphodiesterase [Sagittula marina]